MISLLFLRVSMVSHNKNTGTENDIKNFLPYRVLAQLSLQESEKNCVGKEVKRAENCTILNQWNRVRQDMIRCLPHWNRERSVSYVWMANFAGVHAISVSTITQLFLAEWQQDNNGDLLSQKHTLVAWFCLYEHSCSSFEKGGTKLRKATS